MDIDDLRDSEEESFWGHYCPECDSSPCENNHDPIEPYRSFDDYHKRARAVYWNKETPACRAKGPHKAECLLEPDHGGEWHYGNGFDTYGAKGPTHWPIGSG
jgi:hypothetical protein